jgi:hypothetical protein
MMGEKTGGASRWTRWTGAVLFGVLGVVVLLGGMGLLGLKEHPMRPAIGVALLCYSALRILVNIWLGRSKRNSRIEIH